MAEEPEGLIEATRFRLGVGVRQLARLAGVSPQTVLDWQASESAGTIRVGTLRRAIEAMRDELVVYVRGARDESLVRERPEDLRSQELHRKIAARLVDDPRPVILNGLSGLPARRRAVRGPIAHGWLDHWETMLRREALGQIVDICLRTDRWAKDLRQVSPFNSLLSPDERVDAGRRARDRWLAYKDEERRAAAEGDQ